MDYLVVCTVALVVSGLTLFSGFGLGTLLMPAFALFFPVPVAVAATAVVHLANNVFKVFLVGRHADWDAVLRFALPAAAAAFAGAWLLNLFADIPALATYELAGREHRITVLKIIVAALIIIFAMFDLLPALRKLTFGRRYLIPGGLLSGFFGGLSGHQGALRSAFLINAGLGKEAYIGTTVIASVIVDVARLFVYGLAFFSLGSQHLTAATGYLVAAACAAAFVGAFAGSRLIGKLTLSFVQYLVAAMLIASGIAMATGLI